MREYILAQLNVTDFQFITAQNIDVTLAQEDGTSVIQCMRNGNSIVINDNLTSDEEQPIVVLKKDKSPVGICFTDKSITLRQLKKKVVDEVHPGNFVFLYKSIPITEKQLDILKADQIMFEHDGQMSFSIDER